MLTTKQEIEADFEGQKEDRERLFAVGIAWEMMSKKPKINDIVYIRGYTGEMKRTKVVDVGGNLIGCDDGMLVTYISPLSLNYESKKFMQISDKEAKRRGFKIFDR